LIIDSLTELCASELETKLLKTNEPRQAYMAVQKDTYKMLRFLRDSAKKHIVILCQQEWAKDDSTNTIYFGPSLPGNKSQQGLGYLFDEVFHMTMTHDPATNKYIRWVRTAKDHQYIAKDCSNRLEYWEEPNLTTIFEKILS